MVNGWAVAVFCGAVAVPVYVLAVYPLLLDWWSRRKPGPAVRKDHGYTAAVTVLLPVKNGERWLEAKLNSLLAMDYPPELLRILVISDGSTDRTAEITRSYAARGPVELLEVPAGGKALALNAGLAAATGEVLFFTDVRQPLDRACLRELVASLADPAVGVVSGELFIRDGASQAEANTGLYWKYEKWIRHRLSQVDSVLGATGAVYAMRRSLAVALPPGTLLDDVHLPLVAFFGGARVILDGSAKAYDIPTGLETEFQRKVRTLAGNYQLLRRFPQLLHPGRNRMWIHFLSHKFGRLLLPWALLVALVATPFLPAPWPWWMGAAQAAVYGLALVGWALPERHPLQRLASPARTFCVLMLATLLAASILVAPRRNFWK